MSPLNCFYIIQFLFCFLTVMFTGGLLIRESKTDIQNMTQVYINRALRKDIPDGAVILTRNEVLTMQWNIINNWQPRRDVWPFKVGLGFLAATNAATNVNIILHYRNKLKLGNYGRITMALPATILPVLFSTFTHNWYALNPILLGEECPLCIEIRSAALQLGTGVLFPLITTPIAAIFLAETYGTSKVPAIKLKTLPQIFSVWLEMTKKYRSLSMVIGVNVIAAAALTYFEANSFYKIQSAVFENESRFRRMVEEGINK